MISRSDVQFSVVLDDPSFRFNALHALTFRDAQGRAQTEPLHGHDFRAILKISGPLDETGCVVDFVATSRVLRETLDAWNYKLVATKDSRVASRDDRADANVKLVDARNPSTEEIALNLLDEFLERFRNRIKREIASFSFVLRLEEAPGCAVEVVFRPDSAKSQRRV